MRVLLVSVNTELVNMPTPPLGLARVAAAARAAGHQTATLDLMFQPDPLQALRQALEREAPELVGLSLRNIDNQDRQQPRFLLEQVRPLLRVIRERVQAPLVLGGAGYSIFPRAALRYLQADMGIRGEGERAFPALLARLRTGADLDGLPGLYRRVDGGVVEPEPQPAPPMSALAPDPADYLPADPASRPGISVPVLTRRGCSLDCSYCSTPLVEGRALRQRPLDAVMAELRAVRAAGYQDLFFADSTFNLPASYALALCQRLADELPDLRWRAILYPYRIQESLVRAMARAGCSDVSLGMESGSPVTLRAMHKRFDPPEIRRISQLLARHGIRRRGFLLLGGPDETRATVRQSLDFADELQLDFLKLAVGLRIYPGTPLARRARRTAS